MSVLKKLASETALYGVSSILGRLLNYALVPLHTHPEVFTTEEFSVSVKLFAYVAFFNVLYTYGMETAFFRFASKGKDNSFYNTALTAIIITSCLFSGILILFAPQVASYLGYPGRENLIIWLAIIIAIDAIVAIPFAQLRLEKRAKDFAIARIANIALNVFLNIFFLLICRHIHEGRYLTGLQPIINQIYNPSLGVGYIFLANLIANAAFFLFLYKSFIKYKWTVNLQLFKSMWVYGYPILIVGLAGTTNQMFDRILLETLLPDGFYPGKTSAQALGIYGACYKLSIFMSLAIQAFRYAAEPFFFSQQEDKNAPKLFADVMKWFIIVCVILWVGVSLNLDWIGKIFIRGKEFREGLAVVPILLLANLLLGVYYNLSVWFKLSDRTYYGTWITLVGAIITIVFNIILIPVMGYMGCAITFLISCLVMTIICYALGNKYYPIPYNLKSALTYIISAAVTIFLALQIQTEDQLLTIIIRIALCLAYLGMIFFIEKPHLSRSRTA